MKLIFGVAAALCVVQSIASSSFAARFDYRRVAARGDTAVGLPPGVTLTSNFGFPSRFVASDAIIVSATLTGPGITAANDSALASASPAGIQLVAQEGMPAPVLPPGSVFTNLSTHQDLFPSNPLDTSGPIVFRATAQGPNIPGGSTSGLWQYTPTSVSPLAVKGMAVPGQPSLVIASLDLNETDYFGNGGAVLEAGVSAHGSSTINNVILTGNSAFMQVIAKHGNAAPGINPLSVFFEFNKVVPNDIGDVVFRAHARELGGTIEHGGIWASGPGGLRPIAVAGQQHSSLGANVALNPYSVSHLNPPFPMMNNVGDVTFSMNVSGAGVTEVNDSTLWINRSGALTLLAREGSAAPGTATAVFDQVDGYTALNDNGMVAFKNDLRGLGVTDQNDTGIWAGMPDNLQLLARAGDQAPGLPLGTLFGDIQHPLINNHGHIAFVANLTGTDVTGSIDMSLWAHVNGQLHLVAREGGVIDIDPHPSQETLLTITDFGLNEINELYRAKLSDDGLIAFRAAARDADGVVRTSLFTVQIVPEPTALPVRTIAIAALAARRRERQKPLAA